MLGKNEIQELKSLKRKNSTFHGVKLLTYNNNNNKKYDGKM